MRFARFDLVVKIPCSHESGNRGGKRGLCEGGVPVGSVLLRDGAVMGWGHNTRVQRNDPTSHAEIECLRNAGRVGSYGGAVLFSTLMPCYLCAGAIVQFNIRTVVVGEDRSFPGARELLESRGINVIDLDDDVYS